jgi:DNA-directed RNA polymerase specialized sigma24 family protein
MTWRELLAALAAERAAGPKAGPTSTSSIDREVLARIQTYGGIHRAQFGPDDVEDAVQSILLRLLDAQFVARLSQRAIGPGYFVNWMRNLLVSALRKGNPPEALVEEFRLRAEESVDEEKRLLAEHLHESSRKLPAEDRELLEERYEKFPTDQAMARAKGIPYIGLNRRLNQIRRRLRAIMEGNGP